MDLSDVTLVVEDANSKHIDVDDFADVQRDQNRILPFIVVSYGDVGIDVNVFQLASDNLMEDIRSVATLIKTIQLEGEAWQLIFNELFFGFVLSHGEDDRQEVVLIEKKVLLDASIPSEETEKRQILLHNDESTYTVGMNTTSLVFCG